ncbi:replication protein P [Aeromonas diversa]|uniref:replication protein P n=1 Tax=Aeromonas diversa TaxID=502790 RepID=UPI0039A095F0
MALKPLSEVLAGMPSEVGSIPVRPVAASVSEQDTQVVAKLFEQLKVIFPAWQRAFPNPEMQARALREWTVALVEANCTSREQLSQGMRTARSQGGEWFPSTSRFIKWCEITPESLGLPTLELALREVACRRFTHPAVELAARATSWECRTLTMDQYRPVFEQAYLQLVRRVMAGEDLHAEVLKGLPPKPSIQHSPEYYQDTGQRGVASLRALFRRRQAGEGVV